MAVWVRGFLEGVILGSGGRLEACLEILGSGGRLEA